jgi:hypothetical protein
MRNQILAMSCATLITCTISWGGQALRSTPNIPAAGIRGHITIDEVVGRTAQTNPVPNLKLYLLRVDDSRPLVELQEGCRRAVADPNADPLRSYRTCDQNLRQAVDLIPTLRPVATTETDREGQYEFAGVPAAGRYHVVGVKKVEGAEPLVIVGITNRLRAGERVTLDLSANAPWTRAATP